MILWEFMKYFKVGNMNFYSCESLLIIKYGESEIIKQFTDLLCEKTYVYKINNCLFHLLSLLFKDVQL